MALVIYNKNALIIKLKKPIVKIIAGRLKITKMGRNNELTRPNIKLAMIKARNPSILIPLKNAEANNKPRKFANQVNKKRLIMTYILTFLQIGVHNRSNN